MILHYIYFVLRGFSQSRFGYGVRDKLRLVGLTVLEIIHGFGLNNNFEKMIAELWRRTVVKTNSLIYSLVDCESFDIVFDYYENFVLKWLRLTRGEVFVDVGAHIGKYTLLAAKKVGNEGLVVAVEPHPINYQTLVKNLLLNKIRNVIALNLAAWNKDCDLDLYVGKMGGSHSTKSNWKRGEIKVRARSMDGVFKPLQLKKICWIKIDVEAAEYEILCGLRQTILKFAPKIIIEAQLENEDKIKNFMKIEGYGLIRISPFFKGTLSKFSYLICFPLTDKSPRD